jgi:ribosomal protein S18 acetylase RimI-like enzyme
VSTFSFEQIGPGLWQRNSGTALDLAEFVWSAAPDFYELFAQPKEEVLRTLATHVGEPGYDIANTMIATDGYVIALVSGTSVASLSSGQMAAMTDHLKTVPQTARPAFLRAMRLYGAGLEPLQSMDGHYISRVAVLPEARGRGVGRRIVNEYVSRLGNVPVQLHVHRGNSAALALYKDLGFVPQREDGAFSYLAMIRSP